jgi:hypothetical protein
MAPDAVAEMPEQDRSDRPSQKGDAEGQEGVERLRPGRRLGKESLADHQRGGGAVDIEIVELDRRADETGQHDAADADRLLRRAAAGRGSRGPQRSRHL